MHVQGEVGDLKSGCSGRWEVKYLWDDYSRAFDP